MELLNINLLELYFVFSLSKLELDLLYCVKNESLILTIDQITIY